MNSIAPESNFDLEFVEQYVFHPVIVQRFKKQLKLELGLSISDYDTQKVLAAFKDFICVIGVYGSAQMPSRIVDVLWHTFLLYTDKYHEFCQLTGLGFIHHRPDDIAEYEASEAQATHKTDPEELYRITFENCIELKAVNEGDGRPRLFSIDENFIFENRLIFNF